MRLHVVLREALPIAIRIAKVELGTYEPLIRCFANPRYCLNGILRDAVPEVVPNPKVVLGVCVSCVCFHTESGDLRRVGGDGLCRRTDRGRLRTRHATHQQQGQHSAKKSAHCQHLQRVAEAATAGGIRG